jgi:predicted Zn-dependent peptidase
MQRFTRRLYHPERMVLYVLGNVKPEKIVQMVEKVAPLHLPPLGGETSFSSPSQVGKGVFTRKKDTHQAHVVIGAQAFGGNDPRYLHMSFLSNMLGGPAMSSRLNLALRERNGLVYTVESNYVAYTDTGLWSVYYGCDAADRARCHKLAIRELERLTDHPLSQRTLDAARRQLKGQIGISYDNFENVAIGMAKRYLHYGRTLSQQELFEQLDAITAEDLLTTAQIVFSPERLLTLEYV